MDGYTVEEAASVLGVPRERVWELIARGILTGSTDLGGAMRVRLRSDRTAEPAAPVAERPVDLPPSDASPFRELLTEFRSLTERYGQALLALGEARGEVAGLRSRVDMLEARVDLRLTSAAGAPDSSWTPSAWPPPGEPVVEAPGESTASTAERTGPPVGAHEEAEGADHADDRGSHRRRSRSGRRATESFADALARADDPSPPELPGAAETAAALAGLLHDAPSDSLAADEGPEHETETYLPRDLPSADAMPVAEEEDVAAEAESVAAVDPDEGAEGGATAEPDEVPEPMAAAEAFDPAPEPEPQPQPQPQPEPEAEAAEPEAAEPEAAESEAAESEAAEPEAAEPEAAEPEAAEPEAPESEASGAATEPAWDAQHYSADIAEPGWIAADDVAAPTEPGWDAPRAEAPPWPERDRPEPSELSGSRELDEALAALDALAHPAPPGVQPAARDDMRIPAAAPPGSAAWVRATPPPLAMRSPASRAYRRLKRIFPS